MLAKKTLVEPERRDKPGTNINMNTLLLPWEAGEQEEQEELEEQEKLGDEQQQEEQHFG